jgi:hypothetical protein
VFGYRHTSTAKSGTQDIIYSVILSYRKMLKD